MVTQQHVSSTSQTLALLRQAEQKILSSLASASLSIRSLSAHTPHSTFPSHSTTFLQDLHTAQQSLHNLIHQISTDLPFENLSMRRFIEADLSLQRTAHIHRSLVCILHAMDEHPTQGSMSAAASPGWIPSPAATTPLGALGVAPSPAGTALNVPMPSPDAGGVGAPLGTAIALNGGAGDDEADAERMDI